MSEQFKSLLDHGKVIYLLLICLGTTCWGSGYCSASDFPPLLTQLKTNRFENHIAQTTYQLGNVNFLFVNQVEPYTSYRTNHLSLNQNSSPYQTHLPYQNQSNRQEVDEQPCLECPEIDLLTDEPDAPFGFQKIRHTILPMLWEDTRSVVTINNSLILGAALGGASIIRNNLDNRVRRNTAQHADRWGLGSHYIGKLGEPQYQIPAMLLVYSYSKYQKNDHLHDMSVSMLSAYTITGLSTIAVKRIANTKRPSATWSKGQYGFPSFHTSSSFAIAAVIDEYYGPEAGLPAYMVAGLVGWSRIDERDHDLSDVVFGAALGYVVGKAVAGKHRFGNSNVKIMPYIHPIDGTTGMMFEIPF